MTIPTIDPDELFELYDGLLIDAYGVLVHSQGAVPGAAAFLKELERRSMAYRIITNDASRLETTTSATYAARGIEIPAEKIITAGSLVDDYIGDHGLEGARLIVLGPADSHEYVRRAGASPVEPDGTNEIDGIVVADEAFEPFLQGLDLALSQVMKSLDAGRDLHLICPNPDALYPASAELFGFAAGSFAAMFEHAIEARLGEKLRFARLGKPYSPIYEKGMAGLPDGRHAVLGDQLATDIRGAVNFGLDAYLSLHGVATREHAEASSVKPTAFLGEF